jgi:hypothetical protein
MSTQTLLFSLLIVMIVVLLVIFREHILAMARDVGYSLVVYIAILFLAGLWGVKLPINIAVLLIPIIVIVMVIIHVFMNLNNSGSQPGNSIFNNM